MRRSKNRQWQLLHHVCLEFRDHLSQRCVDSFVKDCCEGKKRLDHLSLKCVGCIESLAANALRSKNREPPPLGQLLEALHSAGKAKSFINTLSEATLGCESYWYDFTQHRDIPTEQQYNEISVYTPKIKQIEKWHQCATIVVKFYYLRALQSYFTARFQISREESLANRADLKSFLERVFRSPVNDRTMAYIHKCACLADEIKLPKSWLRINPQTQLIAAAIKGDFDFVENFDGELGGYIECEIVRIAFWTQKPRCGFTLIKNIFKRNQKVDADVVPWFLLMGTGLPGNGGGLIDIHTIKDIHNKHIRLCRKYHRVPHARSVASCVDNLVLSCGSENNPIDAHESKSEAVANSSPAKLIETMRNCMPELCVLSSAQARALPRYMTYLRPLVELLVEADGYAGDVLHYPRLMYQRLCLLLLPDLAATVVEYMWDLPNRSSLRRSDESF
jgi:hypothetical protein